jgi:hypothetical protein
MTTHVTAAPAHSTPFDDAVLAAALAGWPGPEAFSAVMIMLAAGMHAVEIERSFNDARRWLQ